MTKLIKFINLAVSLTAILASNLSLSAMATDMQAQTHILTRLYTGTHEHISCNRIDHSDDQILILLNQEDQQKQEAQPKIWVDTKAYKLMESKLQKNIQECQRLASYINLKFYAKNIISEFRDLTGLKEFTTKILPCINVRSFSYGSIFLLSIILLSNKGSFIVDDSTNVSLFNELSKLNSKMCDLVNILIQMKQSEHSGERTHLLQSTDSVIDDSFVAASAIIVARSLLSEISALL